MHRILGDWSRAGEELLGLGVEMERYSTSEYKVPYWAFLAWNYWDEALPMGSQRRFYRIDCCKVLFEFLNARPEVKDALDVLGCFYASENVDAELYEDLAHATRRVLESAGYDFSPHVGLAV